MCSKCTSIVSSMYTPHLLLGQGYTKEGLEEAFHTNFGARIKGITLRRDDENNPFILLFSRADGPYSDRIEGTSFFYDGEGRGKDQELTAANKALIEANDTNRKIYGFRQDAAGGKWKYIGLLYVADYTYIRKDGFMTYEYHFVNEPVDPNELAQAERVITTVALDKPVLTDEKSKLVQITIQARSAAFRLKVKRIYDNRCAVCQTKRVSSSGYPEVEAAHIYPKEKLGADDYRNGLSLCRLHHWAFDAGLWALNDNLQVIIKGNLVGKLDYEEITRYKGADILLPTPKEYRPELLYVRAHRELHSF